MASGMKGGYALEARLKSIEQRVKRANTVEVGFMDGATEKDSTSIPMIAFINEFGGTISVPAHDTSIFRKVKENGDFARNGRFVKKSQANFETVHHVEAYTVTIPSRPFFRNMIKAESGHWGQDIAKLLVDHDYDAHKVLDEMGEEVQGELVESIQALHTPANAPSTVAKKGFDDPLIDSGAMWQSATHKVIGND